ncbi:ABC transporter substrate-binding protein [Actinomadura sp. 1N219]|uniref:ABC transporter substrate-binding protein n=1 Tax=Actinomadura sp. 1N219 TaxID=3375152 RepID=UPI00378BBE72
MPPPRPRIGLILTSLLLLTTIATACGGGSGSDRALKVGIIAPLSGALAEDGSAYEQAARAALKEGEKSLGRPIDVMTYDEASKTREAINGTRRLIQRDEVDALLSGSTSGNFLASRQLIDRAEVPVLTIATATTVVEDNAGWTFRVSQPLSARNADNARFAVEQVKARSAAFLQTNDESQRAFAASVREKLRSAGVDVLSEQYFQYGDTDFSPYLVKLRSRQPDVVFLGCEVTQCATILNQAHAAGIDADFVLPTAAASDEFLHDFGRVSQGAYVQTIYAPGAVPTTQRFEQTAARGGFPASYYSIVGYIEAAVLVEAAKQAGSTDPAKIRDALAKGAFQSPLGRIKFLPNGQAAVGGYVAQITGPRYVHRWTPHGTT